MLGWAIGSAIGSTFEPPTKIKGPRQALTDLRITGAEYGQPIPWVRGSVGIAGQVWWNTDRRPTTTETVTEGGGKGGGGAGATETSSSTITYDMDMLIGLTDNEIHGISRIWNNGRLMYTSDSAATAGSIRASSAANSWTRLTVYTGSDTQLPDPTYEAAVGIANAPAYRGRGYVFIQGLKLGQSGQVPNLTFEVVVNGSSVYHKLLATWLPLWGNTQARFNSGVVDLLSMSGGFNQIGFEKKTYDLNGTLVSSTPLSFFSRSLTTVHSCIGDMIGVFIVDNKWIDVITRLESDPVWFREASIDGTLLSLVRQGSSAAVNWYQPISPFPHKLSLVTVDSDGLPGTSAIAEITIGNNVSEAIFNDGTSIWLAFVNAGSTAGTLNKYNWNLDLLDTWSFTNAFTQPGSQSVVWAIYVYGDMFYTHGQMYRLNSDGTTSALVSEDAPVNPVNYQRYYPYIPGIIFETSEIFAVGPVVATASTVSIASVVTDLCLRAGLTADQFDVTALASLTRKVRSMAVAHITATRTTLELLMSTYFFEMVVSDKIYFRPRGLASVATIPYLDLGASRADDQSEPLALRQANELEIPAQVSLSYLNIDDDYQTDTQYSDRLISATGGTLAAMQMPIGMTPSEAKSVADTILLDMASSVVSTKINLLGDYCRLEPTDPVVVTGSDGSTFRMRIVRKTDSYPLLGFEAVIDDVSVLTSQGITSADYAPSTVVAGAADTLMELMDIPILQDADNDVGFYVATKGSGTPYSGSAVFNSSDGVQYTRKATVLESAVLGTCTTTLGNWTGPRIFDEQNSVTVNVGAGTLASTTRDVLLNSLAINLMLIGSEIIQFRTATLDAAGIYTLTGLLRGGRGTEWAMTAHAVSERCVLLREAGMRRIFMENNELGISKYYKGVTIGRPLSSAESELFTDNAVGLKPFSPFDLRASRDASNNITFTWQRRTRLGVRMIGLLGISLPLGEETEAYEIDIFSSSAYTAVLRTISAATATAGYTAAEQTTDGLTPGNAVYARVYMISDIVGRGYKLEQAA